MIDPTVIYQATYPDVEMVNEAPPMPECLRPFYENERSRTIAKLRDLDRLLGYEQTIPVAHRRHR